MELKNFYKKLMIVIAALGAVAFVSILIWGLLNREPVTGLSGITMVNRLAPAFTLTTFDGKEISLKSLNGRPVVINFWASWCPPCREEAPVLEKTWRAYRDRGVSFIGVDIQDRLEDALSYIREFNITYPNGPDPTGEISIDYGVSGLPVTFFVSKKGEIVRRYVGAIDARALISSIEEIR